MDRSKLFFGQLTGGQQSDKSKPTLSGFYRGVGEAQTGAVQDIGQKVQEQAAKLPEEFGVKYAPEGGAAEFADKSSFKPVVATPSTAVSAATLAETGTAADAQKTAEQAQANIQKLKEEQAAAQTAAGEAIEKSLKGAGEKSAETQKRLTEGQLGERREMSQLEQAAQNYRNILKDEPGTSNVMAVANLMKFYDPKYKSLESGLRQGEIALARQDAGTVESQLAQAESQRGASVEGYKQQAEQSYKSIQDLIGKEREKYLGAGSKKGELEKFYGEKIGAEEATKGKAEAAVTQRTEQERKEADRKAGEQFGAIEGGAKSIQNVLSAISGRGSNNWLNKRGHQVLGPIAGEMARLSEEARTVASSINLTGNEKQEKLNIIENNIKTHKEQAAGELAAFLFDTGTHPRDALDAAGALIAAGLVNNLSEDQKRGIRERIARDKHVEYSKYHKSSPEKLQKIYEAFDGKNKLFAENKPIAVSTEDVIEYNPQKSKSF